MIHTNIWTRQRNLQSRVAIAKESVTGSFRSLSRALEYNDWEGVRRWAENIRLEASNLEGYVVELADLTEMVDMWDSISERMERLEEEVGIK